jgi:apolipoprotein D and lipocalin family protein
MRRLEFRRMKRLVLGPILVSILAFGVAGADEPETVPYVDLERYSGKWYEVARLPTRFQKDCVGATAEYRLLEEGKVQVINTCYRADGTTRDIEGVAKVVDETGAKLEVRFDNFFFKVFGWLIKPNYWILDLAEDYSYAVVGSPDRKYLWILSRERLMDEALYQRLLERASAQGFDVEGLVRTEVPESVQGDARTEETS